MSVMNGILSAVNTAELLAPDTYPKPSSPWLSNILIILGLILALFCVALMIVWAFRERKPLIATDPETKNDVTTKERGLFFQKSRHRKYKRRFPTLAEKGGLPPKKENQNYESANRE